MKTRKMSIKRKLLIIISAMILISMLGLGITIYRRAGNMLVDIRKSDGMGLAKVAAAELDGDKYATITSEEDAYYQEAYQILSRYKESEMIEYIYTMNMDGDTIYFLIDTDTEDPADMFEEYEYLEDMMPAFSGETCCDKEVSSDEWGSYFSAYAPILDSKGNVQGIVGCDISTDVVNEQLLSLNKMIFGIVIVVGILCFVIAILISNNIGNNLKRLYNKVTELNSGDGDLTVQLEIHSGDELEAIAGEFNIFISQIQTMVAEVANVSQMVENNTTMVNGSVDNCNQQLFGITNALETLSANMQETSASTTVMTDSLSNTSNEVADLYDKTKEASDYADRISGNAAKAEVDILSVKAASQATIENLQSQLASAAEQCKEIEKISAITEEILDVASKTQMLALNANIEAARAGAYGRGFAVIAENIRDLSQQISVLVNNIQSTNRSVQVAVDNLVSGVSGVSDFLTESVMKDYDQFAGLGSEYSDNMSRMAVTLQNFSEMTANINSNIQSVRENIMEIDSMVGDATASIIEISDRGATLGDMVGALSESAEENVEESRRLNVQVNQYTY